ncbi:16823_t:CDS:2 [Funneliformis geosporum]|nr:16823_t:CDS:2 [Funneliformis geosporum]
MEEKKYQEEAKKRININCLYSHFKDAPQKLKIVCDWDEVIQPLEPKAYYELSEREDMVNSCLSESGGFALSVRSIKSKVEKIKNEPDFYEKAPFLTIAKELLMLTKENKVEQIIFLSAYNKKDFANGDPRKKKIFSETFGKFSNCSLNLIGFESEENAPNCDIVIDDNPNILANVLKENKKITALAPYYSPNIKHHENVLLVKTSLSNLKKEDFQ